MEPVHPLKGKEALFFIREHAPEQGIFQSHCVVKEVPHFFYTRNLKEPEALQLLSQLKADQNLSNLLMWQNNYTTDPLPGRHRKVSLTAAGSKEDKVKLPSPFLCDGTGGKWQDAFKQNSPSKLLRWFYPPGMVLKFLHDIPCPEDIPHPLECSHHRELHGHASLDALVREDYVVLDLELEGWEKGEDSIFMVVYASPSRRLILHNFDFPETEQEYFDLVYYDTQPELGKLVTQLINQDDPLWVYGHNIMNFDQIKLRELTGRAYRPAVNSHYPVTKSVQGLGRVITKGRWTLDSYKYSQVYRNILANNTLETISDDFEKSIDYEQQARLVKEAKAGSRAAFEQLVHYCIEDGLATERLGEELKEFVARKVVYFRAHPDAACSSSKATISKGYWNRRHFVIKGNMESEFHDRRREADIRKRGKQPKGYSVDEVKQKYLEKEFQRGFFPEGHVIYFTPFLAGAKWLLQKPDREILEQARSLSGVEKFDLVQMVNAKLGYLYEGVSRILKEEEKRVRPAQAYNFTNFPAAFTSEAGAALHSFFSTHGLVYGRYFALEHFRAFLRTLSLTFHKTNLGLKKYGVINSGNYFHVLAERPDVQKLEEGDYGYYLGSGEVLSLSRGRFIAHLFQKEEAKVSMGIDKMVYQGISLKRGRKTNFEKRVLEETVRKIFAHEKFEAVKEYLNEEIETLVSGQCAPEEYLVVTKRRTYYKEQLEQTLRGAGVDPKLLGEYHQLRKNIGDRYSDETKKKLHQLIDSCADKFCYPYLVEEVLWNIEHPYPQHINLVYGEKELGLIPVEWGIPELEKYREKMDERFKDFYAVLRPKQGVLFGSIE